MRAQCCECTGRSKEEGQEKGEEGYGYLVRCVRGKRERSTGRTGRITRDREHRGLVGLAARRGSTLERELVEGNDGTMCVCVYL